MIDSSFYFGDVHVERLANSETLTEAAVILFHGFPGEPPRGKEHLYSHLPKRSIDVREAILAATGSDVYFPRYEGLGDSRGRFGFVRSVVRSAELAQELARRHKTIHLVGHSWGGLVAFSAYRTLGAAAGKLVLSAALVDLEGEARIRALFEPLLKEYPYIMGDDAGARERAVADLLAVHRDYNPATLAAPGRPDGAKILILHGTRDETVSLEPARRLHEKLGSRWAVLDDDHSYARDRAAMRRTIAGFLKDGTF